MGSPKVAISLTKTNEDYIQTSPDQTEQAQEIYQQSLSHQPVKTAQGNNHGYCSCVTTARLLSGLAFPPINKAHDLVPNLSYPIVGAIGITSESAPGTNTGHMFVVTHVWADSFDVLEGNFSHCQLTTRSLPNDYSKLIGFYH